MKILICMAKGIGFSRLVECIKKHENIYLCHYECYHNSLDCLENFVSGRFDALFFDEQLNQSNISEIRQLDTQIRLIALVDGEDDTAPIINGIWGFLANPPKEIFIHSLLEHLHEETTIQDSRSMAIKAKGKVFRIPFDHIEYVESLGRNIIFHLTNGNQEEIIGTLSGYADRMLELPDFVRTHRSYLVNLRCVQKLTKDGIHTNTGAFVPVAVNNYAQFKKDYMKSMMLLPDIKTKEEQHPTQNVPHILLVDDNPVELERWGSVLKSHGCSVVTANDEATALNLINKEPYSCIILDVQLGSSNGFELPQKAKHKINAPIIYLSTHSDFEHQSLGFQSGGVDYITKDVSAELFWLKVQSRIQASTTPVSIISNGYLALQIDTREASLKDIPLPLTIVEFNLLHLFVKNPNIIYSPTEIYHRIWGKNAGDIEQIIQLHLSSLSEKLNRVSPHHRYIKAVWGKGYCFSPDGGEDGAS